MRLWAVAVSCVLVIGGSFQGIAQQQQQQKSGPQTLENLLNTREDQTPTATAESAKADATDAGPKRPAGTVARPKDGVQHPDLDKAWANYDAAVAKATESVKAAITKQFDAAVAKGDLDAAEKWQNALEKFEKAGEFPTEKEIKAAVSAAVAGYKKASEELAKAYEGIVKALTMETKFAEAKRFREEWRHVDAVSEASQTKSGGSEVVAQAEHTRRDDDAPPKERYCFGMIGTYTNKDGDIPFAFFSVPRANVLDESVLKHMRGKVDFSSINSLACRGHLIVPQDSTYTFKVNGKVSLNGVVYFDTYERTKTESVDLKKGLYDVEFTKGNPGGTLKLAFFQVLDARTGRELPILVRRAEADAVLKQEVSGVLRQEVTGWRPVDCKAVVPKGN